MCHEKTNSVKKGDFASYIFKQVLVVIGLQAGYRIIKTVRILGTTEKYVEYF